MAQQKIIQISFFLLLAALSVSLLGTSMSLAQGTQVGPSGYKVPRFVSLKSDRVNVRGGPSTDHKVKWIFRRAGLPVEIIQEFENWRRVRDSEGEEGWVYHSLLSGRRTALISPWQKAGTLLALRSEPKTDAAEAVKAQINVLVDVLQCKDNWCQVSAQGRQGWIRANMLWGIYPDEEIEE